MTGVMCCYRCDRDDVVAAAERILSPSWADEIIDWAEGLGFAAGGVGVASWRGRFIGLVPTGPSGDMPRGWRHHDHRGTTVAVTDKRYREGKTAAEWLEQHGNRPTTDDLPGMPGDVWVPISHATGYRVLSPALFVHDSYAWVGWAVPSDVVESDGAFHRALDSGLWNPVRLSIFHLAQRGTRGLPGTRTGVALRSSLCRVSGRTTS